MFIGRTNAKAETPVLWPPYAGRDWEQEEKGTTEDEMAGWHHWLDGRESEWTPGVGDGQGGLGCCDSWGRRVGHDWVPELNWTENTIKRVLINKVHFYTYILKSLLSTFHQQIFTIFPLWKGFPDSSAVKNPPAMQETLVQSLGQEDLLEKG